MRHLTGKAAAPPPAPRRRHTTGDTGGAFRMAARKTLRRAIRLPAAAYEAAVFLSHTLDSLNPWHDHSSDQLNEDFHVTESNDLFPHL